MEITPPVTAQKTVKRSNIEVAEIKLKSMYNKTNFNIFLNADPGIIQDTKNENS